MVEQRIRNARVVGSIPISGNLIKDKLAELPVARREKIAARADLIAEEMSLRDLRCSIESTA